MRGWTADERVMIACCNDGTRPVVFKIERIDYKVAVLPAGEKPSEEALTAFSETLLGLPEVAGVQWRPEHGWVEVVLDADLPDGALLAAAREACLAVDRVDYYWLRPEGRADLTWQALNYFENDFEGSGEGSWDRWDQWLANLGLDSPDNTSEGELP